jgi:hypothetical protein
MQCLLNNLPLHVAACFVMVYYSLLMLVSLCKYYITNLLYSHGNNRCAYHVKTLVYFLVASLVLHGSKSFHKSSSTFLYINCY